MRVLEEIIAGDIWPLSAPEQSKGQSQSQSIGATERVQGENLFIRINI
jgi:hypothetical protein